MGWPDGHTIVGGWKDNPSVEPRYHRRDSAAPDGLARGPHDRDGLADTKSHRASSTEDSETWVDGDIAPTLNDFDTGDSRAVALAVGGRGMSDDPLLPLGLDSHRYRCAGNGVVSSVAEWIGLRLMEVLNDA